MTEIMKSWNRFQFSYLLNEGRLFKHLASHQDYSFLHSTGIHSQIWNYAHKYKNKILKEEEEEKEEKEEERVEEDQENQ